MKNTIAALEAQLGIQLPGEYLDFVGKHGTKSFDYPFLRDDWHFWGAAAALEKNQDLRSRGLIGPNDFAFAANGWQDEYVLLFRNQGGKLGPQISQLSSEGADLTFFAFSMSELVNFKLREKLIKGIGKTGWKKQDLSGIQDCPGSLFWYAFSLKTSEYDAYFCEERNQRALEIFHELAGLGHPEAAHEVACHYYFADEPDLEKIVEWRERAIALGCVEDAHELADFILDNELSEQMGRAVELLEGLLDNKRYQNQALLKLSRIHMKGLIGPPDHQRGIELLEKAAARGYSLAFSDLAMCHYQGIGMPQNTRKAYDLLVEAERLDKLRDGGGYLEPVIKRLAAELGN